MDIHLMPVCSYTIYLQKQLKIENSSYMSCCTKMQRMNRNSYLLNRKQYVEYNGSTSVTLTATRGAPQGSNLTSLIFGIFINYIFDEIFRPMLLFADDLKLFSNASDVCYYRKMLTKLYLISKNSSRRLFPEISI